MNEEVKIYSIDEVLDSIGGYIDCSEFMDYEDDYQYSNIVYYLEKYKEQQQEIDRLNNIINECAEDILKELEQNNHLSYGAALSIRQKLINYKELKENNNV